MNEEFGIFTTAFQRLNEACKSELANIDNDKLRETKIKRRAAAILIPISNQDISKIAESMPGGIDGFCKGWGWQQFARAIEQAHGIGDYDDAMEG